MATDFMRNLRRVRGPASRVRLLFIRGSGVRSEPERRMPPNLWSDPDAALSDAGAIQGAATPDAVHGGQVGRRWRIGSTASRAAEPRRSGSPGFHGVERGTGKTPGRTDPLEAVGQTGRGGGTHRRDLRRPKGPDVSWRSSTCMINSPIRFMAMSSSAFTGSPLRSLSEASLHAQLPRQKFHRLATQKPQGNLTLARHRPPLAKSQRACRRNLARGKRASENCRSVPVLLGHFD